MEIIAHRGASHDAPENTLAAARLAWAQSADALECDVQLTRDGRLAVIHDHDTRRLAGVTGRVAEITLAELQRLDVGRGRGPEFAGERIPSLEALLAVTPPKRRVFVELKGGPELVPPLVSALNLGSSGKPGWSNGADETAEGTAAVPRVVQETARRQVAAPHSSKLPGLGQVGPERIVVIAFDLAAVAAAKQALPAAEACWIVGYKASAPADWLGELIAAARSLGLDGLDLEVRFPIDAPAVERAHAAGLKVYVWTVDDPARGRQLAVSGVDGIATNRPGWLRAALGG